MSSAAQHMHRSMFVGMCSMWGSLRVESHNSCMGMVSLQVMLDDMTTGNSCPVLHIKGRLDDQPEHFVKDQRLQHPSTVAL